MKIDFRVYEIVQGDPPPNKRFFCLPFFAMNDKMQNAVFTYGPTEEAALEKAETFWNDEIAKARANAAKTGGGSTAKGRPVNTAVTPEMLAKIDDDFDPKG